MPRKVLTLCIIHKDNRLLLGLKKRGFGEGLWNGFGGKVEEGETIEEGAKREMREESGIEILDMAKRGILEFEFKNDPKIMEVHVFAVTDYRGEAQEMEEMRPQWFGVDEIPFANMWPDDKHWMQFFLDGKKFKGRFLYDEVSGPWQETKILEKEVSVVEEI
jgi:8-oxo-dGTP diphosphatase / 2-hydroxy-dATP diphosphatase